MNKWMTMLLGIAVGATIGGAVGAIAGAFTDADLATGKGFLYSGVPVIFFVVTLLIIANRLSLYTVPFRERIGWLLLLLAGVVLGGLEGLIGGVLLKASPERIYWMLIKGDWGATLGMLLVTIAIAVYMRSK
jgi:CDP-diglyceride synthetase